MRAVDWFVKRLRERGVKWMATLCGHGLDPLYYAAKQVGIRLVDTRNEQTAGYMAEAYGKLTGRPGVCAVSSGVAHVNAMTGVASAYFDGAPMLLISGAGALRTAGMGHFQDFDQVALARPVTRYARVVDCAERTVQILDEALDAAIAPQPGPVHLTFPMDVQNTELDETELIRIAPPTRRACLAADEADRTAASLTKALQPLIVAGSGVYYSGAGEDVVRFSERFSIPLVVPIWDRGCVNRPVETFMGVLGAASGGPRLLPDADCIVMAGAAADYRTGFLQAGTVRPAAVVLHRDSDWGDVEAAYERLGGKRHQAWLEEARRRRDGFRQLVRQTGMKQARQDTHAIHIIAALQKVIRDDTVLLIDGGSIGQWAHQLLCDCYPSHWLTCGRSGVVGWGLGGAMAARLTYPDRPVILLAGDGAFTFNVAEIERAVGQSLPFVAIVADDLGWGITRAGHLKQFGESISSSLGSIAMDKLADALGASGVRTARPEEILPAIERSLGETAVTVIHVPIVGGNP
jgi:acetolactate synthase-1/2/3 large subunit